MALSTKVRGLTALQVSGTLKGKTIQGKKFISNAAFNGLA